VGRSKIAPPKERCSGLFLVPVRLGIDLVNDAHLPPDLPQVSPMSEIFVPPMRLSGLEPVQIGPQSLF
jgi:hypothetical protein